MPETKRDAQKSRAIVQGHLEKISSAVFDNYQHQITDLIGSRHGVYALFREGHLYYIGLATDLKRRIRHHLRDRHRGRWDYFSLYMIRKEDHIRELESLLVRIASPSGNRVKGKLGKSQNLLPFLRKTVSAKARQDVERLFGEPAKDRKRTRKKAKKPGSHKLLRPLRGLVPVGKVIHAIHKGRDYRAKVYRNGTINLNGELFYSPSGAAKAITGKAVDGWHFWKYKDKSGDMVPIDRLRK